ncbi:uncharacterized protein LOC135836551 [Planococcus citri]|uniref:uncharacterized protein LOC135836551 n=1 Tax=Planococcus citri TaxID=170843 RepID=UPI0031F81B8D
MTNFDAELADPNKWTVEDEVHLLYGTLDNKPVGVDKHFQMSIIWDKFTLSSKKSVNSDVLWRKLNSWYNLKSLDDNELLPFKNNEEEFKLPVELIPESYVKSLTDDEKKSIDVSGLYRKYVSCIETDDEDSDSKTPFKLKGNEKLKWFENPQYKSVDRARIDTKQRPDNGDLNESIVRKYGDDTENKKVIRQYGKAGEVSSGTIVTLNFPSSDNDDNFDSANDATKDDTPEVRNPPPQPSEVKNVSNSDQVVKIKRTRSNKFAKAEPVVSSDAENSNTGKASPKITPANEPTPSTATRSRKASIVSQETPSNTEAEKVKSPTRSSGDEKSAVKRRFSQRCSSTSESKPDSSVKPDSSKIETKRKSVARR